MILSYIPQGTCSRAIEVELNKDHTIANVRVEGGCNGNLQGIMALLKGQKAEEAIARLKGIRCGGKPTSCPDQISIALQAAIDRL